MNVEAYHARLGQQTSFQDVIAVLSKTSGFSPLLAQACQNAAERLSSIGLVSPLEYLGLQQETLISEDGQAAILVRSFEAAETYIDLLGFGRIEEVDVPSIVSEALDITISAGSFMSAEEASQLEGRLGALSPNGKKLAEPAIRAAVRRLYDDQLRKDLTAVAGTIGDNPVPVSFLERQIEVFGGNWESINKILSDATVVNTHFMIVYQSCGMAHLAFETKDKAENVVSDAGHKCFACGEQKLAVEDGYSIRQEALQGIQQGLWLESLASDTLSQRSNTVWTGQMFETNEMDVLAVYLDKTILIECKDSSFGQNDLYVTAAKAEEVGADEVILLSTRDIHPNVREAAKRIGNRGPGDVRAFTFISEDTQENLEKALNSHLDAVKPQYAQGWMAGNPDFVGSQYYYRRYITPAGTSRYLIR